MNRGFKQYQRSRATPDPIEDPLWYKDAVIYELRVRAFYDSNGDGIGDFRGLTKKLDYIQDLGVNTIWLLPFYPSPLLDDGYDISDYRCVHPNVGTLRDFKAFLREAHGRGLRVITELVLNHTSDQHALFQKARRAPAGSRSRDFYIWSDTPERFKDARIIFKDFERSNWTWDPEAQAYYWHRFYSHQPDLNYDNPAVWEFVRHVVDFWLDLGVDGLRLDAVPYLYEREGTCCENLAEVHTFLKELRRHVDARHRNRVLLAEANQWPEDAAAYFGSGDECHMAFHFPLMPRMFMAIHMEDRFPVIEVISQTPPIPESCQWAVFLRNHDELTLEMVTDEERDYMYRSYAEDTHARINLGIRRRFASLMHNNRRRIELMNALLFSLPGTPVVYYGDEIGMGDNIYLGDRNGVRTPMQWSADRNAGFSTANPQQLFLPVIIDPEYHYETINVETQEHSPSSLLRWMKRLIHLRNSYKAFGRGEIEFLYPENPRVLAFLRRHQDQIILVVANLSRFVQYAEMDLSAFAGMTPVELFGHMRFPVIGMSPFLVTLGPHSFYWFGLEQPRSATAIAAEPERKIPEIEVRRRWNEILIGSGKLRLEEVLPGHLRGSKWFGKETRQIGAATVKEAFPLGNRREAVHLALVEVEYIDGGNESFVLPLSFLTASRAAEVRAGAPQAAVAEICSGGGERGLCGLLIDSMRDSRFAACLVEAARKRRHLKGKTGDVVISPLKGFDRINVERLQETEPVVQRDERSGAVSVCGKLIMVKIFRQLDEGVNPDIEVSRFLVERTSFVHTLPVAAVIEFRPENGEPMAVGVVRLCSPDQRDAWSYTMEQVRLFFDRAAIQRPGLEREPLPRGALLDLCEQQPPRLVRDLMGEYLDAAGLLGRRTAEMHVALGSGSDDPGFSPEPFSPAYRRSLYQSMRDRARHALQLLRRSRNAMTGDTWIEAERVLALEDRVLALYKSFLDARVTAKRTRCHGYYRLRQLLRAGGDFLVADFEGDTRRSHSNRRTKRSPIRDVASLLRSFHYTAFAPLLVRETGGTAPQGDLFRREPWALLWQVWASAAFLGAYLPAAAAGGFLPADRNQLRALLDAYLLEEAIYALGEELEQRPGWVKVPLHAIQQLLRAGDARA